MTDEAELADSCEKLFRELAELIRESGKVTHTLGGRPYCWATDKLEHGSYSSSPAGPFDWIKTIGAADSLYVYLRLNTHQHSIGMMHRIDFRSKSRPEALSRWHQKMTQARDANLTPGD